MFCSLDILPGKYKVETYDHGTNSFMPTPLGLGMHVEVRDPDDSIVMSRVRDVFSLISKDASKFG